jgi:hypothetical protein
MHDLLFKVLRIEVGIFLVVLFDRRQVSEQRRLLLPISSFLGLQLSLESLVLQIKLFDKLLLCLEVAGVLGQNQEFVVALLFPLVSRD